MFFRREDNNAKTQISHGKDKYDRHTHTETYTPTKYTCPKISRGLGNDTTLIG